MRSFRKLGTAFVLSFFCLLVFPPGKCRAADFRFAPDTDGELVIVIDPGHGGENLGADYDGYLEKEMNLIVAEAMYEELTRYEGVTVYMTRNADTDVDLQQRADFAASVNADFLFCLHFNMSPDNNLFGSEVWIQLTGEENREGYRFGVVQMETMADMGLYIRGIKTRINDRGTDYYGILRHCKEYGITAALIEHCHVDHEKDRAFCDSVEDLQAFGRADATSVAKYFGLSSSILGVDYSDYALAVVSDHAVYMQPDGTDPEICQIYEESLDYEAGEVVLTLTASDPDSPMLYYSYSIDGGITYTPLTEWPEADMVGGNSPDAFRFTVQVPAGVLPRIRVRAYNQYDHFLESNTLSGYQMFPYPPREEASEEPPEQEPAGSKSTAPSADAQEEAGGIDWNGTGSWLGDDGSRQTSSSMAVRAIRDPSLLTFLVLCLICVLFLFVVLLITRVVLAGKRRKRRKSRETHNRQR